MCPVCAGEVAAGDLCLFDAQFREGCIPKTAGQVAVFPLGANQVCIVKETVCNRDIVPKRSVEVSSEDAAVDKLYPVQPGIVKTD